MDWTSRIEGKLWEGKPFFLLATSPGGRGAISVLSLAANSFPHMGANVVGQFSLPNYNQNFSIEEGITNKELEAAYEVELSKFIDAIDIKGE